MRNGSVPRISFIFSDDPKCLLPAIITYDRDNASELDGIGPSCCVHDIRGGAAGVPIAQFPSSFGQSFSIALRLGRTIFPSRSLQGCLDQFQPPLCDQVGLVGNRSVGKLLDEAILVNECSAHTTVYGYSRLLCLPPSEP